MDASWEDERVHVSSQLSTPTNNAYRTSPSSMSRHPFRRRGSPPGPSASPPPFIPDGRGYIESQNSAGELSSDDSISPLDPRRFTPTLHASLVSEILSLRRDLESKVKIIDTLEGTLHHTKIEAESLQDDLINDAKEKRSLKRQLQMLEGGSNSAVTELAKERDDAWENITEVRKRLEETQKKSKSHESQVEKTQRLWDLDRKNWDEERRKLDTKIHIVEGRLKIVLNEVAASQTINSPQDLVNARPDEVEQNHSNARACDRSSIRSTVETRRISTASVSTYDGDIRNGRLSVLSMVDGYGSKFEGSNLADELAFDEAEEDEEYLMEEEGSEEEREEEEDDLGEEEGRWYDKYHDMHNIECDQPDSRIDERPVSTQPDNMKARKILGLSFDRDESFGKPDTPQKLHGLEKDQDKDVDDPKTSPKLPHLQYRDIGIQYTPPPSPKVPIEMDTSLSNRTMSPSTPENKVDVESHKIGSSRNDDVISPETVDRCIGTVPVPMISNFCQTTVDLPSPSRSNADSNSSFSNITTTTSTTQTDEEPVAIDRKPPFEIPMIAVHPPGSNPPSPRNSVVLPPRTKNASSQTISPPVTKMSSSEMQTDETCIGKSTMEARPNLLPSAISDQPDDIGFEKSGSKFGIQPFHMSPPRNIPSPPVDYPGRPETSQAYPGNNDNGPLAEERETDIRRPFRSSSLFAGFDNTADEDVIPLGDDVFSGDDILNRPMESYTLRSGKLVNKPSPSILDEDPAEAEEDGIWSKSGTPVSQILGGRLQRSVKRPNKPKNMGSSSKRPNIRRAAMISNSTAAHQMFRPRSPSAPNIGGSGPANNVPPPFPVPIRLSSRNVPTSASEGAQSPTPDGDRSFSEYKELPLRKSRSEAAVSKPNHDVFQSNHSPTTPSTSPGTSVKLPYPPMPFDDITAPRSKQTAQRPRGRSGRPQEVSHQRQESTATNTQQTSVVDATAQTMVGEWMWKYVRRRKSFGMTEQSRDGWEAGKSTEEMSANISGNGVRHKRWVWLAPYERAVMWSNKQPTSGMALLGKSGRKLTIQNVLDVKDENPLPKGAGPNNSFNRSILILTPQRALKFTALTIERHFVWLTALSFLSHSSAGLDDLTPLPPVPQVEHTSRPPAASLRRNPIRDSIKVAKGKARPFKPPPVSVPEIPAVDETYEAEPTEDAADPPNVPRFSSHARKRSNTAPKPLQNALRNLSNHVVAAPSTYSQTTAGSSDPYSPTSVSMTGNQRGQDSPSHRTSEASGGPPPSMGMTNFFDAVGTVRMEAFVDRTELASRRQGVRHSRGTRRKERNYWQQSPDFRRSEDDGEVIFRNDDPFRGF